MKDLLHLKQFLTHQESKAFYEALVPDSDCLEEASDGEFADDPLIDEAQ